MSAKLIFSMCSIGIGLLLIIAGLGYTVNQASNYTSFMRVMEGADPPAKENPDVRAVAFTDRQAAPSENHNAFPENLADPSENHTDFSEKEGGTHGASATTLPLYEGVEPPSLFIPALAILSGAVFAVMGAIAMVHRFRGIR